MLANFKSCNEAQQRWAEISRDQEGWTCKAILYIVASGKLSSDRTIAEYAIGNLESRTVPHTMK